MLFAAGGGNLFGVSHLPWLLCQQQLHYPAAWRADRRRCLGQVRKGLVIIFKMRLVFSESLSVILRTVMLRVCVPEPQPLRW